MKTLFMPVLLIALAVPTTGARSEPVPPAAAAAGAAPTELTVERIYDSPPIIGRPPQSIRWLPDSRGVSYLEQHGEGDTAQTYFVISSLPKGKRSTLCIVDTIGVPDDLRDEDADKFKISSYEWANEGDLGLLRFKGELFTIDRKSGGVLRRTRSDVSEENPAFSPDGRWIAFTREHDLWAIDLESNAERQLTTTGSEDLLNGVLDWLYMEELFTRGDVQGHWWSPDGRKIAYLQIDESPVHEFPIVDFVPAYNTTTIQHYPNAGSAIPIVRVGVYDFESGQTTWMGVDTTDDSYIARLYWLGDSEHVAIEKINRDQNEHWLYFADISTGEPREVLHHEKPTWINITYMKHYYKSKDQFVWNTDVDGHSHLYLYENDGTLKRRLTEGDWEVTALNGVYERRGEIYFTGLEKSILERHLYRVNEKGGGIEQITKRPGTHNVTFSPDFKYYIDRFSAFDTPRSISVHKSNGESMFIIDQCEATQIADYELPKPEFFRITSTEGIEFQCSMIKPNDFDESKRYPVIIFTYGGPHRQVVRNRWEGNTYLWHAVMASKEYIIFSLDNRGSFGRGTAWENPILENMGHVELEDQLAGVDYLKSLPYVDASRIGIWGWSYGGYMTCMAMFKAPGVFKAGASIAPVTSWRFYDSIYTERYMKQPDDNEEGYEQSAPINFVDGLEAPFFLAHGMADDNVHVANSIRLVHELINAGKDFEFMVYPRKLHGISGKAARVHLFKRLTAFFEKNL